jgi:hypothetical protein
MSWFLLDYMDDPMFFARVFDPGDLSALATGVKVGGQLLAGTAAKKAGEVANQNAQTEAAQEVAAGQKRGFERDATTRRVIGEQIANAAGSGSAVASPTILDIVGETAQRGKYLEESENASAATRANAIRYAGEVAKRQGQNAFTGSILQGLGTSLTGAARYRKMKGSSATADEYDDPLSAE